MLGRVEGSSVILSEFGKRIEEIWLEIGEMHSNIDISDYIIMPNHFHGIINVSEYSNKDTTDQPVELKIIYNIIRNFKSFSTHEYNIMNNTKSLQFWQRGYYDHIIRDQKEYDLIKRYVETNPVQWSRDKFYLSQ